MMNSGAGVKMALSKIFRSDLDWVDSHSIFHNWEYEHEIRH